MDLRKTTTGRAAFTLIELLVVITIIAILMALLFPAFRGVQDQAKRTQAKNDVMQIVTAVNAFYTEYGRYPLDQPAGTTTDVILPNNGSVMDVVRNDPARDPTTVSALNPKGIVFLTPPTVKDANNPRSGIASQNTNVSGIGVVAGDFVDPWGTPYVIAIDGDYSGFVKVDPDLKYGDLTYTQDPPAAGPAAIQGGMIGASYGKDQVKGRKNPVSDKFADSDDVISWQ